MTPADALPSLVQIEETLAAADTAAMLPLRLAVLREITIEPIDSYLRYLASRDGLNASVTLGAFGQLIQDAVGGAGILLDPDLDAVLVFAPLSTLSPPLASSFASLDAGQVREEVERITRLFELVVGGIRRQTGAMILWHGLEPPLFPALGILDAQKTDGEGAIVSDLNAALRAALHAVPGAYFVDMGACLARVGGAHFYDSRFWHLARAPYTPRALAEIAAEDVKFLRALKGRAKKCLVLDCDNTLWGGVVGEDGLAGIKLGSSHPGSAYVDFQREIVSLFHRGVIIALCSRNNEDDVWEVFDRLPDMVVRREHVSAARINWCDKATNLRALAEELNVGLDSIVLAEDSEFEAGLVRDQLPEVEVLQLPGDRPAEYRSRLSSYGLFDVPAVTDEDRARGAMYRIETARRRARSAAPDLEAYYRSLDMTLEIGCGDEMSIPRVAQLTQKTNQFNLTTRRYGEGDIAAFVKSPQHEVLWIRVRDRLGDLGIVGACIVEFAGPRASIDTLLLSCRALGRGVEQKFLDEILHLSRAKGADAVWGEYVRTAKNAQVEQFFPLNGFAELDDARGPDRRLFEYRLDGLPPRNPGHFANIVSPQGTVTRGAR